MKEQVITILQKARETISKPDAWTRQAYARDSIGKPAMPDSHEACSFCVWGSLFSAAPNDKDLRNEAGRQLIQQLGKTHDDSSLVKFNDSCNTKHQDVLDLFDATIERLKECPTKS